MIGIVVTILLVAGVGVFLVYGLRVSLYLEYPKVRCLRRIAKEAAYTRVASGMRNRDVYDKDGKVRPEVQRRMDNWQDNYFVFLRNNVTDFEKVLLEKHWLDDKGRIKSWKAVKIANDFLNFYDEKHEENA